MNRITNKLLFSTLLAMSCGAVFNTASNAASAPEVSSSVWEEGNAQYAAVTLNGKELISFHGLAGSNSAEQRAEDLADKLQNLIEDPKFDIEKVVPAHEGAVAEFKQDGSTILKFDGFDGNGEPAEKSLKVLNALRTAYGVAALPDSSVKMADGDQDASLNPSGKCFSGAASWYGPHFHGRKCADGSRFDMYKFTAAHKFLPLGTKLLVRNRRTGDKCIVKVNDRGPFVGNRVIDLSKGAAQQLNMLSSGVAMVDCIVLGNN